LRHCSHLASNLNFCLWQAFKDAGGILWTHSLEASEGGLESGSFALVKIIFYARCSVRGCSGKPTVELHSGTRTCSGKPGALPSGYAQNPLFYRLILFLCHNRINSKQTR
jgi:hypothetical protein